MFHDADGVTVAAELRCASAMPPDVAIATTPKPMRSQARRVTVRSSAQCRLRSITRARECDRFSTVLSVEELRADVESGAIDTVIAAFTDMQGRLMGKRLDAEFFLEELDAGHEVECCNYLLALEMEMDPVPGYAMASWERGYGDFGLQPDLGSLRRIPWHEATALVLCDVQWHDGSPVAASPRQVLKAQLEKARALGYEP